MLPTWIYDTSSFSDRLMQIQYEVKEPYGMISVNHANKGRENAKTTSQNMDKA